MENALSTLANLPSTKVQIKTFVEKAKEEILSGQYDPLQVEVVLKAFEETVKALRDDKDIKDQLSDEVSKYEKSFVKFGAKITQSSRTVMDYKHCQDAVLMDLERQVQDRKKKLELGFDSDTGEALTKPVPKTSQFLKIEIQ
jgi:hypothetical protein